VRTEDGGHTWEIVTPPDGTPHVFRDVEAFNPNHAVVLASETGMDSCGQLNLRGSPPPLMVEITGRRCSMQTKATTTTPWRPSTTAAGLP
jgi:hypothetical protein